MNKKLPDVTLVAADSKQPRTALESLNRSREALEFAHVLFFTHDEKIDHQDGVKLVTIPPIKTWREYSRFVAKELHKHVQTSHILIVQHDGWIVNPSLWTDRWLKFDYIGSPWPYTPRREQAVGNGGFSLRSTRLMKLASTMNQYHPEDVAICRKHREMMEANGMVFADLETALTFSQEGRADRPTFGCHKPWAKISSRIVRK